MTDVRGVMRYHPDMSAEEIQEVIREAHEEEGHIGLALFGATLALQARNNGLAFAAHALDKAWGMSGAKPDHGLIAGLSAGLEAATIALHDVETDAAFIRDVPGKYPDTVRRYAHQASAFLYGQLAMRVMDQLQQTVHPTASIQH